MLNLKVENMLFRIVSYLAVGVFVVTGHYFSGMAPVTYCEKDMETDTCKKDLLIYVNRLNSRKTVIPYEYDKFDLCAPDHEEEQLQNLGEVVFGERIRPSPYKLEFLKPVSCQQVCEKSYLSRDKDSNQKLINLKKAIGYNYHQHWILDNMPVRWCYQAEGQQQLVCETGFPLGCWVTKNRKRKDTCIASPKMIEPNTFYLYNHVDIRVKYHRNEDDTKSAYSGANIISASISFRSIKYSDECIETDQLMAISGELLREDLHIRYTYSVSWEEDLEHKWASRWDYILENVSYSHIQWFGFLNSLIVLLVMTAISIGFLVRALVLNVASQNQLKNSDNAFWRSDGWRLLQADVFRPPRYGMILSALCGSGIQVLFTTIITLQFAVAGLLSPAYRGALGSCILVVFTLAGFPAGVASARVFKKVGGEIWQKNSIITALLCPGFVFFLIMVFNIIWWSLGSSAALPLTTILALLGLWLGISLPLTCFGAFLENSNKETFPSAPFNETPRPIPKRSILCKTFPGFIVGGIPQFGCVYIQMFFIMNSIWNHQVYNSYGLLLLALIVLLVTCSELTVLLCYFHLCAQDYHWWWRSFLYGGSCGVYVFLYSIHFYFDKTELFGGASTFLYFGYMLIISFVVFLLTGSVGFFACWWFVKKIYSVVN